MNSKFRLKKSTFTLGCILMCVLLVLAGCAQKEIVESESEEQASEVEDVPVPEPEPEPESKTDAIEDETHCFIEPVINMVFDFAEFSETDFPRGNWTINQLIKKYGIPDETYAYYNTFFGLEAVFIHEDIYVSLYTENKELLSFYDEILDLNDDDFAHEERQFDFDFNKADKNLQFEVLDIIMSHNSVVFPRSIKIGESSRQEVIDAYPPGTANLWKSWGEYIYDKVRYSYAFRNENDELPNIGSGGVTYFFNEDEILDSILVSWFL